eukprot:scaffold132662_cov31-Prasinocladus_malaysianus.AAC.1
MALSDGGRERERGVTIHTEEGRIYCSHTNCINQVPIAVFRCHEKGLNLTLKYLYHSHITEIVHADCGRSHLVGRVRPDDKPASLRSAR